MFKNTYSVQEKHTWPNPGQMYAFAWQFMGICACTCAFICLSVLCACVWGGIPRTVWTVLVFLLMLSQGGFWSDYPDLLILCVFACAVHTCMYLCCLTACAPSSSFSQPAVCCLLQHTQAKIPALTNWFWTESCVCASVCVSLASPLQYFVRAPVTMAPASCSLSSQRRNPTPAPWVFVSHVYFHRRVASSPPSFHLLPSFIVCGTELHRWAGWDGDQGIKNACVCAYVCRRSYRAAQTDGVSVSTVCLDVIQCVHCTCRSAFRETYGCKWDL